MNPTTTGPTRATWPRIVRSLPVTIGLILTAAVWAAGAVWSFSEQRDFAAGRGFDAPALLPLTIDGLALALAVVAWSAALDGRAAVQARSGAFVALAASALSNATYAYARTRADLVAVGLAAGVPLAAAVAFETLLAELRRGVHRRRGLPAPAAVAGLRLIRLALSPRLAWSEWRAHVLTITSPPAVPSSGSAKAPEPSSVDSGRDQGRGSSRVAGQASVRTPGRKPGRAAGWSPIGARVARLASQHPDWTTGQIAQSAGCSARTVRRHLNASRELESVSAPAA